MDVSSGLVVALLAAEKVVGDCAKGPSKVVYSLTEPRQRGGKRKGSELGIQGTVRLPVKRNDVCPTNKEIRGWEGGRKAVGRERKAKQKRGIILVHPP
jgi:hypothetical protein